MTKRPEKIREQIARLEQELEQAEKERIDKNHEKITKAAERTGLDQADLTASVLEREFRELAKRMNQSGNQSDNHSGKDATKHDLNEATYTHTHDEGTELSDNQSTTYPSDSFSDEGTEPNRGFVR